MWVIVDLDGIEIVDEEMREEITRGTHLIKESNLAARRL